MPVKRDEKLNLDPINNGTHVSEGLWRIIAKPLAAFYVMEGAYVVVPPLPGSIEIPSARQAERPTPQKRSAVPHRPRAGFEMKYTSSPSGNRFQPLAEPARDHSGAIIAAKSL